jgi:hypothetical protein
MFVDLNSIPPSTCSHAASLPGANVIIHHVDCGSRLAQDARPQLPRQAGRQENRAGRADNGRGKEADSERTSKGYDTKEDTKLPSGLPFMPQVIDSLVELSGIEPLTSSLRTRRSPS